MFWPACSSAVVGSSQLAKCAYAGFFNSVHPPVRRPIADACTCDEADARAHARTHARPPARRRRAWLGARCIAFASVCRARACGARDRLRLAWLPRNVIESFDASVVSFLNSMHAMVALLRLLPRLFASVVKREKKRDYPKNHYKFFKEELSTLTTV